MHRSIWVPLIAAAGTAAAPVTPGLAADTSSALRACAAEADDARRLACFDRIVAGLEGATGVQSDATRPPAGDSSAGNPSAAPAAAATAAPVEQFGLRKPRDKGPRIESIEAKVVKVSRAASGVRTVTLDNGQVWTEIEPHSGARLEAGDAVTIKSGAFGSFDLVAPNNRSSKVRRAR